MAGTVEKKNPTRKERKQKISREDLREDERLWCVVSEVGRLYL